MTDWVGGQLSTQGVSAVDEPSQFEEGDREAVKAFSGLGYSDRPHMDEVTRTMRPWLDALPRRGSCWVGRYCFPAVDGDRALKAQL